MVTQTDYVMFGPQSPGEIQTRTTTVMVPNMLSGLYYFGRTH